MSSTSPLAPTPMDVEPHPSIIPTSPSLLSPNSIHLTSTSTPSSPSPTPSTPSSLALYLSKVPLLSKLNPSERSQLASALTPHTYPAHSTVVREGDEGDTFYLIHTGTARVTKAQADGSHTELALLHPQDYFGEQVGEAQPCFVCACGALRCWVRRVGRADVLPLAAVLLCVRG